MGQTALLIIDMQMMMQHRLEAGRDHVNGAAPARIAALAQAFRAKGRPVIHIRHRDADPASPLHADAPGYPPMPCAAALPGEAVMVKSTSSAFASTPLADHLRAQGISDLVVTGAVAGFCVNSTIRAGADLGFRMILAADATLGFDLPGHSAQAVFDVTIALLAADFAEIATAEAVMAR